MERRRFSREFKLEAVKLVKERGVTVSQAAPDLELHENVLRKWIRELGEGPVRALTFVAERAGPAYVGCLPIDAVGEIVAVAAGHWGSTTTYLFRTASMVDKKGICDSRLWTIQAMVTKKIRGQHRPGDGARTCELP